MSALADLIKSAGGPVSRTPQRLRDVPVTLDRERRVELETVLHLRDGFRALEGALFVRPSVTVGSVMGIEEWNRFSGWRKPYAKSSELLFFAEDVFGWGFALLRDTIVRFNPERGTYEHYAFKLEAWAARVLKERDTLGVPEVREWNEAGKPELRTFDRLQPSVPRLAGTPTAFLQRTDRDLMSRYARLYRELVAADGIASSLELYWWASEDPDAPKPAPVVEPEPEPVPVLEPEPPSEPEAESASAPEPMPAEAPTPEPIPDALLASAEAEVEALLRENAEARVDDDDDVP